MATNYYNAQIGVVDASGNVNVIYPITKASNVDVTSGKYGSSTTVTDLQSALNNLTYGLSAKEGIRDWYVTKMAAYLTINSTCRGFNEYVSSYSYYNGVVLKDPMDSTYTDDFSGWGKGKRFIINPIQIAGRLIHLIDASFTTEGKLSVSSIAYNMTTESVKITSANCPDHFSGYVLRKTGTL